jgi:hypothetical protein
MGHTPPGYFAPVMEILEPTLEELGVTDWQIRDFPDLGNPFSGERVVALQGKIGGYVVGAACKYLPGPSAFGVSSILAKRLREEVNGGHKFHTDV